MQRVQAGSLQVLECFLELAGGLEGALQRRHGAHHQLVEVGADLAGS